MNTVGCFERVSLALRVAVVSFAAVLLLGAVPAAQAFADEIDPGVAKVEVKVKATVNGGALLPGESLNFTLSENKEYSEGDSMVDVATACVDSSNQVASFGELTFKEPGKYSYKVSEVPTMIEGWMVADDYDLVFDVRYENDCLVAKLVDSDAEYGGYSRVSRDGDAYVVSFGNSYYKEIYGNLNVHVEATGATADVADKVFEFQLVSNGEVLSTAFAKAGETVAFDYEPVFTKNNLGEHVYTIRQVGSDGDGWTFDKNEVTVTVTTSFPDKRTPQIDSVVYSSATTAGDAALFTNAYVSEANESAASAASDKTAGSPQATALAKTNDPLAGIIAIGACVAFVACAVVLVAVYMKKRGH